MKQCLDLTSPHIQQELEKLTKILGDANAAYAVLALNNGHGLDRAPNGHQSNLFLALANAITQRYDLTSEELEKRVYSEKIKCYSPTFLNWFGDWIRDPQNASKVVDENGEPLLVWHKSDSPYIYKFNLLESAKSPDELQHSIGFHFGTLQAAREVDLQGRPYTILPYFINIQHPMPHVADWAQGDFNQMLNYLLQTGVLNQDKILEMRDGEDRIVGSNLQKMYDIFKSAGYDGYWYINNVEDVGSTSYALFNPDQVYNVFNQSQDTFDILELMRYQYTLEGLTMFEIFDRQRAYLNEDPDEIRRVRRMVDQVQIRQAQLHVLGRDFGQERHTNGYFDWNTYLKGIDLRHDIAEEVDLTQFPIIEDYQVDPAEIIMPKLYKTQFKLGNKDIAEIDAHYFKRANPYYNSHLKDKNGEGPAIDILVRTHTSAFNVVIGKTVEAPTEGLLAVTPKIENGWRLDQHGNKMYRIPEELNYKIYQDSTGQETICIQQSDTAEKLTRSLIDSTNNLVSIQLLAENIDPSDEWIQFTVEHNNIKTNNSTLSWIKNTLINPEDRRTQLKEIYNKQASAYKNDLANTLYNSFIRSLYLISVRIPTQAFQSIMAVKVAGLTNDDSNNVFVTRWQFWLQGSRTKLEPLKIW